MQLCLSIDGRVLTTFTIHQVGWSAAVVVWVWKCVLAQRVEISPPRQSSKKVVCELDAPRSAAAVVMCLFSIRQLAEEMSVKEFLSILTPELGYEGTAIAALREKGVI